MRGDHDQRRCLPVAGQLPGYLETRLLTQADIDQQHIGPQCLGALDRLGARVGHPGHGNPVPFQHCPRHVQERLVVIDYHAPQLHSTILPASAIARIAASRSRSVNARPRRQPGGIAWRPLSLLASWKAGSMVSTRE
jgi:hypothetical protein